MKNNKVILQFTSSFSVLRMTSFQSSLHGWTETHTFLALKQCLNDFPGIKNLNVDLEYLKWC
jgi:hypothetical protein